MKKIFIVLIILTQYQFLISQTIIKVTDCNLQGWTKQTQANTALTFKNQTSDILIGKGSLEFSTSVSNFVRFRNNNFHNTLLSSLTALSYSCLVTNRENTLDANYLVLQIDKNNDGLTDDRLEFDPRFQTGSYIAGIGPDQGASVTGVWQTWDALHGGWWVGPSPDPDAGGEMFTLATYITRNPNARIVNDAALGGGGIRLSAGAPFPLFAHNFKCLSDKFTIGINGITTIYDFEFTTADAGEDKQVNYGYGSNCITLNGSADGGSGPYTFAWSPGSESPNSSSTKVCPTETTTYTLTVTDSKGCVRTDDVIVNVNDVRCGSKMDKVKICHNGEEICVAASAVDAHLNHGDNLGNCSSSVKINTNTLFEKEIPAKIKLSNFPNPFTSSTVIFYQLPVDGKVNIIVYDLSGKMVSSLVNEYKKAGQYTVSYENKVVSNGIYYCKILLSTGKEYYMATGKLITTTKK